MGQERRIRILLFVTVCLVLAAFLLGFLLGQAQREQAEEIAREQETVTEPVEGIVTVESMKDISGEIYYVRVENDYLVVYKNQDTGVFMHTGIPVTDLPDELRMELKDGIVFYDLETLYNFLENYSI